MPESTAPFATNAATLRDIRVISFDLDDTLWDCDPVILHAESVLYDALKSQMPRITENFSFEDVRDHRMRFGETHREYAGDVTQMRIASLKALLSDFSYPQDSAQALFDLFYRARSEVVLYSDALPVLEALGKHYKLAALTNGNADLSLIGIDQHFQDIQHASVTTPPKPARDMFDRTADKFSVTTSQILHIGDNPVADVGGASGAGAVSVWFNQHQDAWPEELPPPDIEISSLKQLIPLLCSEPG